MLSDGLKHKNACIREERRVHTCSIQSCFIQLRTDGNYYAKHPKTLEFARNDCLFVT